jgi:hypothetical protein
MALMAFTLAGCGDDGTSDTSSEVLTDDATIALEDDAGDAIDQSDEMFGEFEIPDDIPLPEEHEIVQAIGNPEAGYTVILNTPKPFGEVADFYEIELPAVGWESVDRQDASGADVVSIEANRAADDHSILVQVRPDGDGSSVTIYTGPPGG